MDGRQGRPAQDIGDRSCCRSREWGSLYPWARRPASMVPRSPRALGPVQWISRRGDRRFARCEITTPTRFQPPVPISSDQSGCPLRPRLDPFRTPAPARFPPGRVFLFGPIAPNPPPGARPLPRPGPSQPIVARHRQYSRGRRVPLPCRGRITWLATRAIPMVQIADRPSTLICSLISAVFTVRIPFLAKTPSAPRLVDMSP